MSIARTVAAELVRFGAELAAGIINGAEPNENYIARQLAEQGVKLVGVEAMKGHLTAASAARVNAEVDAAQREKFRP